MSEKDIALEEKKGAEEKNELMVLSIRERVYNEMLSRDVVNEYIAHMPKYNQKIFLDIYYALEDARCINCAREFLNYDFADKLAEENKAKGMSFNSNTNNKNNFKYEGEYKEVVDAIKRYAQTGWMCEFFASTKASETWDMISDLCSKMIKTTSYFEALRITKQITEKILPIFALTFLKENY